MNPKDRQIIDSSESDEFIRNSLSDQSPLNSLNSTTITLNSTMSTIVPIETLSTSQTCNKSNSFTSILRKKTRTTKEVDDFIQNQPNQATLIDNETGLPFLTYAVQVNDVYAVGRMLETSKVGKKYILHALDAAVGKLKADCVEVLLEHWKGLVENHFFFN